MLLLYYITILINQVKNMLWKSFGWKLQLNPSPNSYSQPPTTTAVLYPTDNSIQTSSMTMTTDDENFASPSIQILNNKYFSSAMWQLTSLSYGDLDTPAATRQNEASLIITIDLMDSQGIRLY